MNLTDYDRIVISSSAGKDSQAMLDYVVELADAQGIDRSKLLVVHADLGRAEWAGTSKLAAAQATQATSIPRRTRTGSGCRRSAPITASSSRSSRPAGPGTSRAARISAASYRRTGTCGSKAFPKTCTDKLKIGPIYRFLSAWVAKRHELPASGGIFRTKRPLIEFSERFGKIDVLIGIAAGEEKRVAKTDGPLWMQRSIRRVYPLIDLGLDRAGCQALIRELGVKVPPPSNCMLCPFLSDVELVHLERFHPEAFQDWVEIEAAKLARFEHLGAKNFGVWGRKTLREALADAQKKFGSWSDERLQDYKMSHGHCVASSY